MDDTSDIQAGDLVRPSVARARERASWSGGQIPSTFIAWDPHRADPSHRLTGLNDRGQVHIQWDAVGLVVEVRSSTSGRPGDFPIATVQFNDAVVMCAASRLERVSF